VSGKTDPRLDVLRPLLDGRQGFAISVLNSLDAVDPRRRALDTLDALDPASPEHEALVERLAPLLLPDQRPSWSLVNDDTQDRCRAKARAVLAALREAAQ